MKTIYFFLFLIIGVSSCAPEEDLQPQPTDARDNFASSWTCAETSKQNGTSSFTVHITKSTTSDKEVILENFYNYGFNKTVVATISGSAISIASQTFSGTNTISGGGTLNGTKISMDYVVDDGSGGATAIDSCKATLTKQ